MKRYMSGRIVIQRGDITTLSVDAIVTAANKRLSGGGGVDGAVHRAAGPGLLAECRELRGCPTGEARITGGHGLLAAHVIHAVGPVWVDGTQGEDELLASCYEHSLRLALEHRVRTIAFPAIATGAYGFPIEHATEIALGTTLAFLDQHPGGIEQVIFCCFSDEDLEVYEQVAGQYL